jgi:nicotinamide riboside transporter PnuC
VWEPGLLVSSQVWEPGPLVSVAGNDRMGHCRTKHKAKGEDKMRLSAPKQATWWIALVVGVIGILANLVTISVLSGYAFWLVVVAFVLLILATLLKDL